MKGFLLVITALLVISLFFDDPKPSAPVQVDPAAKKQEEVTKAKIICDAVHSIGYAVICGVDEANQTIFIRMNTSTTEAEKICSGTVMEAYKNDIYLGRRWKIKILPPMKSGTSDPLAVCTL